MEDEDNPDLYPYDDSEDEDEDAINCWVCNSCGKVESERPAWGGQCPRCGCVMEEEYL